MKGSVCGTPPHNVAASNGPPPDHSEESAPTVTGQLCTALQEGKGALGTITAACLLSPSPSHQSLSRALSEHLGEKRRQP